MRPVPSTEETRWERAVPRPSPCAARDAPLAPSSLVSAQTESEATDVDQREYEGDDEHHHGERRAVAEAKMLEDDRVRVQRDRLGVGAWASARARVEQVEDA